VLGLSWGGVVAQQFQRLFASRVSTLVLSGTYAGWKGSLPDAVCRERLARCEADSQLTAAEFVMRWVPEMFGEHASNAVRREMADIMADFHPAGFRLMAKSLAETDTTTLLPHIDCPALLLWGDQDQRSPMRFGERLRDLIPGAALAVIADAGHLSNMEQPEAFNTHVRQFCRSRAV
jgi:pimeloyl-ACP methyl ester carboxylesterase